MDGEQECGGGGRGGGAGLITATQGVRKALGRRGRAGNVGEREKRKGIMEHMGTFSARGITKNAANWGCVWVVTCT